jgi:hypothetical protein
MSNLAKLNNANTNFSVFHELMKTLTFRVILVAYFGESEKKTVIIKTKDLTSQMNGTDVKYTRLTTMLIFVQTHVKLKYIVAFCRLSYRLMFVTNK